jgi:hypothetical protein
MAGWKVLVLENFLLLFCMVSCERQPDTLNVLSILLPYSTAGSANVNFTIGANDGCYKWFVYLAIFARVYLCFYALGINIRL